MTRLRAFTIACAPAVLCLPFCQLRAIAQSPTSPSTDPAAQSTAQPAAQPATPQKQASTKRAPQPEPGPPPAYRIDVAPLGYEPPGAFYLTYQLSSAALSFIDDEHLLFTFRVGGLLRRVPSDHDGDDDQQIRAVVLDAPTGKVLRQAEWRMHDRSQYLWPLADGKFLVRVRDSLFLTDESLELRPYLTFDSPLREIQVSPDRRLMVVERDDPAKLIPLATEPQDPEPRSPVKVEILTSGSSASTLLQEAHSAVHVPLVGDGMLDVREGSQLSGWAVRDVPFAGKPRIIAEVKSGCEPTLEPVSAQVVLIVGCYQGADDRPVVAVSTDGKELWRERWDNKYVWGWFTSAQNGSRFAYESVQVSRPVSTFDQLDGEDITAQLVGVYDTDSGNLILLKNSTPVLTAGQNVSLSPDGSRFAVLRKGAIEIYDLPPEAEHAPDKTRKIAKGK
jgi:hypothetical protein